MFLRILESVHIFVTFVKSHLHENIVYFITNYYTMINILFEKSEGTAYVMGHLKKYDAYSGKIYPMGIKRFSCNYCSYSTCYKYDLKKHVRIHTGERPYVCKICGKSFAQTQNLKSHLLSHSLTNSFKCEVCGKEFRSKIGFKFHYHNCHKNSL